MDKFRFHHSQVQILWLFCQ